MTLKLRFPTVTRGGAIVGRAGGVASQNNLISATFLGHFRGGALVGIRSYKALVVKCEVLDHTRRVETTVSAGVAQAWLV